MCNTYAKGAPSDCLQQLLSLIERVEKRLHDEYDKQRNWQEDAESPSVIIDGILSSEKDRIGGKG
jgi:hypothetical protein